MDSVDKAKAVLRRQSKRQLKPLFVAIDSFVDGYRKLAGVLTKPFPVFLLSNAIIVLVACLSKNNINKKKQTATASDISENLYGEYLYRRRAHPPASRQPEPKAEVEKAVVLRVEEKRSPCYRRTKSALVGGRLREVDDLSNEEFKRTVESYIAKTKWFLQKEITADLTETAPVADRTVVVRS